jgi:hypothetical protein
MSNEMYVGNILIQQNKKPSQNGALPSIKSSSEFKDFDIMSLTKALPIKQRKSAEK